MKKTLHLTAGLLFIAFYFSACVSTESFVKHAEYDTRFVPADYDPSRHILLIEELGHPYKPEITRHEGLTSKLDKALKEYFPYRYEIVSLKEIEENKKYSDTSIYRFGVLHSATVVRNTTTTTTIQTDNTGTHSTSVSPSARTTYYGFGFYDRKNKSANSNGTTASARIEWSVAAFSELVKKALQEGKK